MPRSTARRTTAKRTKQAVAALPETVRVGIYLRRSTDDEHQPYSIEAQEERLCSYVDSQPNWVVALRFADDASGATTQRKDLQRALSAARNGLVDVLLVYRVDRLSRSLRDTVHLLEELDQAGVVFRSATEPFDTATPIGRMLLQMLAIFAQFERDKIIAGMERKAAKGLWKGGRRPFGYQAATATPAPTAPANSPPSKPSSPRPTKPSSDTWALSNAVPSMRRPSPHGSKPCAPSRSSSATGKPNSPKRSTTNPPCRPAPPSEQSSSTSRQGATSGARPSSKPSSRK